MTLLCELCNEGGDIRVAHTGWLGIDFKTSVCRGCCTWHEFDDLPENPIRVQAKTIAAAPWCYASTDITHIIEELLK